MVRGRVLAVDRLFYALVALTAVTFAGEISFVFLKVPTEARMGIVQKIFYFHVPIAYSMYLGATACFIGSIRYLLHPSDASDALARAGAQAPVAFGAMMLTTGPLWGAKAWGAFRPWDPPLPTPPPTVPISSPYAL